MSLAIQTFNVKEHYAMLIEWLTVHKAYLSPIDEIPEYGFVAYCDDVPTAMAFIRRVEGGYAQLDGLTSNPSQPAKSRSDAIDLVVARIKYKAKALGIKSLIAFSLDKNTLERSKSHGFVPMDKHNLIVLPLI